MVIYYGRIRKKSTKQKQIQVLKARHFQKKTVETTTYP